MVMDPREIEARRRAALLLARKRKLEGMAGLGNSGVSIPGGIETLNRGGPACMAPDTPTLVLTPDGRTIYNKDKDFQKVFYLRALSGGDAFPVALSASGTAYANLTVAAEEAEKGDYEIVKLMATSSVGRFSVEMTQPNVDRIFSNNPIPNNLVFGSPNFPGYLAESIYVPATSFVRLKLTDLNGTGTNDVRIVAWGRRFLGSSDPTVAQRLASQMSGRMSHPFWLTFNDGATVSLTASQSKTFYMRVPSEADFECFGAVDDSDNEYTISLYDGNFRQMMDGAIPARNFFAGQTTDLFAGPTLPAAGLPMAWPFTHVFKASTQIRADLVETSGVANTVRLALYGRLLYYPKA